MDDAVAERIGQLAKNLKDMHLAASEEEAYQRAKDIVLGTAAPGTEKSIKELMQEAGVTLQDLQKAKNLLNEEEQALRELKKELAELKAKQLDETAHHAEHTKEAEKLDKELSQEEHDLGVVKENIEVVEQVQEKSQKP